MFGGQLPLFSEEEHSKALQEKGIDMDGKWGKTKWLILGKRRPTQAGWGGRG